MPYESVIWFLSCENIMKSHMTRDSCAELWCQDQGLNLIPLFWKSAEEEKKQKQPRTLTLWKSNANQEDHYSNLHLPCKLCESPSVVAAVM